MTKGISNNPEGRPVKYTIDHPCWAKIIEEITHGKSLSSAIRQENMPTLATVMKMIKTNPDYQEAYKQAIEDRADRLVEEIIELSDEQIPEHLEGGAASAWVQKRRLMVDTRKWVASKMKPKVYGDRIDVSVTDARISVMEALNEARQRVIKDESNIVDVEPKNE